MYYKKIWIIILIIVVVSSLFPSVLIAKADEGEYPDDDIPDLEFSLQDAPFPGTYSAITQVTWQAFLDRADELGHTIIMKFNEVYIEYDNNTHEVITRYEQLFYSTDGTDIEVTFENDIIGPPYPNEYYFLYNIRYKDYNKMNILDNYWGHRTVSESQNNIFNYSRTYHKNANVKPYHASHAEEVWYRADIVDDPYQDKPERYNIDPSRGWGMSFLKPAFGDWINIPHKLGTYKDFIEIEIQVPQIYEREGISYRMFNVSDGIGQMAIPNFAIKLHSHNVKKIEGSQVVGRDGIWILPNNIRFVEGYMDGSYMHGARFLAKVPIEHAKPADGGHSLIVADLFLHEVVGRENYSVEIPEGRTWTKYLTYLGTVDSDGDGFDDRTGLPITQPKPGDSIKDDKPNRDDYEDGILGTISYYFDTLIWYIKQPFVFIADLIGNIIDWISTTIDSWIDGFTSIFTRLFSFLPAEVILMLALGFATLMIITIIRAIRGS